MRKTKKGTGEKQTKDVNTTAKKKQNNQRDKKVKINGS